MQADLREAQELVNRLTFLDKIRLLEYLAPLIARSASAVDASFSAEDTPSEMGAPMTYPAHSNRETMKQEIEAYHRLHPVLVSAYLGEYVAIYQGRLVDHDVDAVALHKRIGARFPDEVVLRRKVTIDPEPIIYMRSPRFERLP